MNWFNIAQELEEMLEKTGKELKSANKDIAILSENFKELEKRCQMLEADNGSLVEKLNRLNPRFRSKTRTQVIPIVRVNSSIFHSFNIFVKRKKTFTSGLTSSARSTKRPRKNCSIEPRGKELKFDHYWRFLGWIFPDIAVWIQLFSAHILLQLQFYHLHFVTSYLTLLNVF